MLKLYTKYIFKATGCIKYLRKINILYNKVNMFNSNTIKHNILNSVAEK